MNALNVRKFYVWKGLTMNGTLVSINEKGMNSEFSTEKDALEIYKNYSLKVPINYEIEDLVLLTIFKKEN